MAERYDHLGSGPPPDDDSPYAWISEWLCEYVDGTMDPSMQAVFEEYMEANPELAAHVERLCRTRALLSECECRREAAERAKARLHRAKQREEAGTNEAAREEDVEKAIVEEAEQLTAPLSAGTVAAVASAMTLMLGVGVVAGATLFADRAAPRNASSAVSVEEEQRAPDRSAVSPRAQMQQLLPRRTATSLQGATSPWAPPRSTSTPRALLSGRSLSFGAQPLLPLKKMPTGVEDSAHASHTPTLVQTTELNP